MNDDDALTMSDGLRRSIYTVLVMTALVTCVGRILSVRSRDGRMPFLSANDRSRWCTIRALVDSNSYVIDRLQKDRNWQTIDKVRHEGRDQKLHFYSSKPPLLPTLLAPQYWLIRQTTGATFEQHPFAIARAMLMLTNVVPLAVYFWLLVGLIERWCETDWGRLFATVAAVWGTYVTTFAVTLNNHVPAAIGALIVLHVFITIWYDEQVHAPQFIVAGLAAGFAAANELPALSLVVLLGLALLWKDWLRTICYFAPALALVVVAFFATNYVAHDSWLPPYAHRGPDNNWYDYPDSYWLAANRRGVDRGEPSRATYAWHALAGHHGVFSLTPIWCLSVVGLGLLARRQREVPMPLLALGVAVLSAVCMMFYLMRPLIDRNYGGVASGFRWMFWFTPLWLFAMLPALDRMSVSTWSRRFAYLLLAVSVLSASYPSLNPWQHPWPYRLAEYLGWL